jgi:hypothetical protein
MGLAVLRDISLLWLIFLTLIAILPFGILFFYAIKGMIRLRALAKLYLPIAQDKARMVSDITAQYSNKATAPIISVYAKAAQVNGLRKAIFRRKNV